MFTRAELSRTVEALTGEIPDISGLPIESEVVHLTNDASRAMVRNGAHQRAILMMATIIANDADLSVAVPCEAACTDANVRAVLERAFVDQIDDASVSRYRSVYTEAAAERGHEFGMRALLQQVLVSPRFHYRTEIGVGGQLRATELARKLSYFLWGHPPDEELRRVALDGSLMRDEVYRAQVDRLLADSRARGRVVEHFEGWLHLSPPDLGLRAAADGLPPTIINSMRREFELLVSNGVFDQSLGLEELLTSSRTYLDGDLASLYGISGITGTEFQEASLEGTERRGLLTTAYVLASHAKEDGRSPMVRGKFLIDAVMCQAFPPDAGVAAMSLPAPTGHETFRERFAPLEILPPCSNCHRTLNAGFALDIFDNVGRRWPLDQVASNEAAGRFDLPPHAPVEFSTTAEAIAGFAAHPALQHCFVIQAYRLASGAMPGSADAPAIEAIERSFVASGQDVRELFRDIALSVRFREAAVR
jgi:hypothetical protein